MKKWMIGVLVVCAVWGCAGKTELRRVGADRDRHGCIGSAGYMWSKSLKKCVRPWEQEPLIQKETESRAN